MPHTAQIFVSYASEDEAAAVEIVDALDFAGLGPWIASRHIELGQSFVSQIDDALGYASYLLLLLSEASLQSEWVRREWTSALATEAIVLLPALLEPCTPPPLLRGHLSVELYEDKQQGIAKIVEFLKSETKPIAETRAFSDRVGGTGLESATRRSLRLVALRCMSDADLQGFLFDAEIQPATIGGANLHERLLTLLHVTEQEGILRDFADWLGKERSRCVTHQLEALGGEDVWTSPRFA